MEGQILILDMNFLDFFYLDSIIVNTNVANTLLVRVQRDADFTSEMIKKLNDCFFTALPPEIVTTRLILRSGDIVSLLDLQFVQQNAAQLSGMFFAKFRDT